MDPVIRGLTVLGAKFESLKTQNTFLYKIRRHKFFENLNLKASFVLQPTSADRKSFHFKKQIFFTVFVEEQYLFKFIIVLPIWLSAIVFSCAILDTLSRFCG